MDWPGSDIYRNSTRCNFEDYVLLGDEEIATNCFMPIHDPQLVCFAYCCSRPNRFDTD